MANPFDQFDQKAEPNPYDVIEKQSAAQQRKGQVAAMREVAAAEPWWNKLLISTGKGFTDTGRGARNLLGANIQPDETEKLAWEAMQEEAPITSTIGEIIGQAAPFVPLSLAAFAATASRGLGAKVLGQAAVGGLEGATIASGTGGDVGSSAGIGAAISGGIEALNPVLGRISRQAFQRITGKVPKGVLVDPAGRPTDEMREALNQAGLTWEELTAQARQTVSSQPQGALPEQVARMAGFEQMQAPYSLGNITQRDVDVGAEQRLLGSIMDPSAEQYRNLIMRQSQAFTDEVERIAGAVGDKEQVGELVKDALFGRRGQLKAERKELYGRLAETARNAKDMPIFTNNLLDAVDPDVNLGDIRALSPDAYNGLNRVLVEFGILRDNEALELAAKTGIKPEDIKVLGLDNYESFRKRLGQIAQSDRSGAIANITGPIRQALDNEVDDMVRVLALSPSQDVAAAAKAARQANIALKTEFDPKAITTKLTDRASWGSNEPKVYASRVYASIMANSSPIEQTRALVDSLGKAGSTGKLALREMQGQAVLDLLDSSMKAQTNKINGQLIFNGNNFAKAFDANKAKIELLFKDDPEAFKRLQNVVARSIDITPSARMTPKGSADINMDMARSHARRVLGVVFGAGGADAVTTVGAAIGGNALKSAKMRAASSAAANAKPQRVEHFNELIIDNYPRLAAALGVSAVANQGQEQQVPQ
jgi:hypothetical protein